MIKFICDYWREILCVGAIVVNLVLWIVRKRPVKVVDSLKEIICRLLPGLIAEAEKSGKSGSIKKDIVLSGLKVLLRSFGYTDDIIHQYMSFAGEQVEVILSTPQKKGVL